MAAVAEVLDGAARKVRSLAKKQEKFLQQDEELVDTTKLLAKVIYDVAKLLEEQECSATLPELIIEGFDAEQVWAGVELQNQHRLPELEARLQGIDLAALAASPLLIGKPRTKQEVEEEKEVLEEEELQDELLSDNSDKDEGDGEEEGEDEKEEEEDEVPPTDADILNDPDFQNMSDSDGDDLPLFGDLSDDERDSEEGEGTLKERERKGGGRKTEVDDQFFKLSDMEKFLDAEDRKEANPEEKDEEMDLFDGGEEEEDKVMYGEYYNDGEEDAGSKGNDEEEDDGEGEEDGSEGEEEEIDDDEVEGGEAKSSKPKRLLLSDDDEDDEPKDAKSSHEVQAERLARRIGHLEEAAVGGKGWQMGGEVAAPARGENSLLAEHLEYDTAVRAAPVVTEAVARRLEDIVRQRVKDKAWDDVERKVKPVEDPMEYKKKLVLDQEKSKLSLAQVYEEEFVKLAESAEAARTKAPAVGLLDKEAEETPAEVAAIRAAMHGLFRRLDGLTHLHYTPQQKSAELRVVRNLPTIAMEEVAPVAASNATLLAPAEVVDKAKGELMDQAEKSETDKKRERREKKAKKSAIRKNREAKEALVEKLNPLGALGTKYSKQKAMKKLEEAEKQGKVTTIKGTKDKAIKSSTSFFSSLQDEVKTGSKEKAHAKKKKQALKDINVASLKL